MNTATSTAQSAADILRAAKALIPDEAHWWRGEKCGKDIHCALTAIVRASPGYWDTPKKFFELSIGGALEDIPDWNGAPERTLAEVHAAFDRAIALACQEAA